MRVSFVIPTRNQARFIRRCLDSCLAQGLPDAEILVVDGASTDGTQQVLETYGDRISWISERDSGQAEAVNKGVARATGEIVAWINSDDLYADDRVLRDVVAAFEVDETVDVVYGEGLCLDAEGRPMRRYGTVPGVTPLRALLQPASPVLQPATFFRRRLFLEAGGLRTDLHFALDYDLWLRLFPLARRIRHLPRTLAHAAYHSDAKSVAHMLPHIRETVAVKREHAARLALGPLRRLRLLAGVGALYVYWLAVRLGLKRVA